MSSHGLDASFEHFSRLYCPSGCKGQVAVRVRVEACLQRPRRGLFRHLPAPCADLRNRLDSGGWTNGRIYLTVLAPPAQLEHRFKDVKGLYAFDIAIAPCDVTPDAFRGVGILGQQIRYGNFTRCG
jgi:hypothetical protein